MSSRFHVIQRIEYDIETGEPVRVELFVFDVCMVCDKLDVGVELLSHIPGNQSLGFLDVFLPEEELAIEVAQVDGVEVDDVDFAKPGQDEVLEELAANTACADEEDTGLARGVLVLNRRCEWTISHLLHEAICSAQRLFCEPFTRHGAKAGKATNLIERLKCREWLIR